MAVCVKAGVHCCDLTGESFWVKKMIDQHHAEAERTGAKIVPSCGFDSIPAVSSCRAGGGGGICRNLWEGGQAVRGVLRSAATKAFVEIGVLDSKSVCSFCYCRGQHGVRFQEVSCPFGKS